MKKIIFLVTVVVVALFLQGCGATSAEVSPAPEKFNVCIILDGTDQMAGQGNIPHVSADEIVGLASHLPGMGTLYLTYVDDNCENNPVAIYEIDSLRPISPERQMGYEAVSAYQARKAQVLSQQKAYDSIAQLNLSKFRDQCVEIEKNAYSDLVVTKKQGSDIHGAMNQAIHLLQSSAQHDKSYIVLVSDGVDNIGKNLDSLPASTELLWVSTSVSKHKLDHLVTKEFSTFEQASKYLFN